MGIKIVLKAEVKSSQKTMAWRSQRANQEDVQGKVARKGQKGTGSTRIKKASKRSWKRRE